MDNTTLPANIQIALFAQKAGIFTLLTILLVTAILVISKKKRGESTTLTVLYGVLLSTSLYFLSFLIVQFMTDPLFSYFFRL